MKTIQISSGEIRLGYELADLSDDQKELALEMDREFMSDVDSYNEEGEIEEQDAYIEDSEAEDFINVNGYLLTRTLNCSL